jgi:hypothetical protein
MPLWCIVLCFINSKQYVHALVVARSGNITYSPGGDGKASAPDCSCKVLEISCGVSLCAGGGDKVGAVPPTSPNHRHRFLASSATQRWRTTSILLTASLPMEPRSVALPRLRGCCLLFSISVHQHLRHLRHLWYLLGWTGGYCCFFLLLSGLLLHWR